MAAIIKDGIKFFTKNPVFVHYTKIKLWKDNPRFNESAVYDLAQLFKYHGMRSRIVVWIKDNTIYKGNTSYKALRSLGCKWIPVDWQDFPSEAAASAYGVSDNASSEYSKWDRDVLSKLMKTQLLPKEKKVLGFSSNQIGRMIDETIKFVDLEKDTIKLPKVEIAFHPAIKEQLKQFLNRAVKIKFKDKVFIKFK